jgi:dTDP-glucose 4,6-dehydratase
MNIVVTGGLGFIGSHFIELILDKTNWNVHCVDKETYAANLKFKEQICNNKRVQTHCVDVSNADLGFLNDIDLIVHFAAESHVDNSIKGPLPFVNTNVLGTFNLLEFARKNKVKKFVHISTDEVYGAIEKNELSRAGFAEDDMLKPSSVYSSSKAASDLLVYSYFKTYKLHTCITRCCNNYGPRQNKEKLLPKAIIHALTEQQIPVYGQGDNIREWIYVKDHCEAVLRVAQDGNAGSTYNIGTGHTLSNLALIYRVLCILDKDEKLITFVEDRAGHDFKYLINSDKINKQLNWKHNTKFNEGLERTIDFYKNNL